MEHIKLFENFDRYEFITYDGDDISASYAEMIKNVQDFDTAEYREIETHIETKSIFVYTKNTYNGEVCVKIEKLTNHENFVTVYYLGDYVYAVVYKEWLHTRPVKMTIVDGIESVIEALKKIEL